MKIGWLALVVLGSGVGACLASRGPTTVSDAGKDARDAPSAKESAPACPAPAGGNDLSFDLECSGGACDVKTHIDFHLDATSSGYPGCGVGQGNLELADLSDPANPGSLMGTGKSSLEMDVTGYSGVGAYKLEPVAGKLLLFELSSTPPCSGDAGGSAFLPPLLIADTAAGGFDAALLDAGSGAPPSCDVKVEADCTNDDGTHNVAGTLTCSFENVAAGYSCTLSHGKFQFGRCLP